jgi:2'-phosphotransferase
VEDDLLLEKINDPSKFPAIIHGTYFKSWDLIKNTGLKTMGRNHVHFAIGMPGEKQVISGMRTTC